MRAGRDYEEGTNLSKITVDQEPGLAETLLTAELDATHTAPTFAELGVRAEIVRALGEMGIERTFAIQELTLPLALAGEDLIGQARTGMGKTFGFGVPLLHRIATADTGTTPLDGTPRALIIVPTRELCIQVTKDLENASKYLTNHQGPLRVASIYGGRPYEAQIAALRSGVDVVVGTPGRLLDLADQQHLILGKVGVLVLDEADEMLDLGFLPDIERILGMVPDKRQTMLFSATMPGPIITLARTFLSRPTHIRAEEPHDSAVHDRTAQFVYRAHALDKSELIARILQAESRGATMIFTRTKRTAQKVADDLAERGFAVGAVHGDLGQIAREKALTKFRKGAIDVLVATDVAARGIDIDDVTHVVNYQCPEDEKTYVHRIGRTGRAGRTGVAVTLIDWDELNRWSAINSALGLGIPEPVETYSRSPHLYSDLGIPEGVTGVVRTAKPERDPEAVVVERPARTPRKRNRRRTRGGQPIDGAVNATDTADTETPAGDEATGPEQTADEADKPARRRRRRRKTTGDATDNTADDESSTDASGDNDADRNDSSGNNAGGNNAGGNNEDHNDADETGSADRPARRRRRRRRSGEGEAAAEDTGSAAEPATAASA
nr:DEAD/DEAH box helicase [Nocardia sp. CY15]